MTQGKYLLNFSFLSVPVPFAWYFEGERLYKLLPGQTFDYDVNQALVVWAKVSVGAFLAFFLETAEFLVLRLTSSLTLSIAGIFKELIQLTIAVSINSEILSGYNDVGLVLCLGGICLHVVHKYFIDDRGEMDVNEADNPNIQMTSSRLPTSWSSSKNHGKLHKTPLLMSSDESNSDSEREDSNEILFDIVSRREDRRAV